MKSLRTISSLILILFSVTSFAGSTLNIKTAPIYDAVGISNIEIDIKVSEKFTVGPSYSGFNYEHSNTDLDADFFGIRANYYFDKALSSGWLIGLSASFGDFTISEIDNGITFSTTTSTRIYSLLLSRQSMWDSFNITYGLGVSYFSLPSTITAVEGVDLLEINTSFISGIVPNLELTFGWKF